MLVTIAIIGIAMTLIIPGVQRIQASSRQAACVNNLRAIGQAANAYAVDSQQLLPW
jgi:type II secretory pathway pseudopilin PulG